MMGLLGGVNLYDLYRYNSPDHTPAGHRPLVASSPERIGTTIINGEVRTYKRGYTMKEYTPWLKHHPMVMKNEIVYGDIVSDFLNDEKVRT
jgi:hypothetical protein